MGGTLLLSDKVNFKAQLAKIEQVCVLIMGTIHGEDVTNCVCARACVHVNIEAPNFIKSNLYDFNSLSSLFGHLN